MAFQKTTVSPELQQRLVEMAAELRSQLYGETGYPVWGTKFREIESLGMSVGLELARLLMEQSVEEQAKQPPQEALSSTDDTVMIVGTGEVTIETEAGEVKWDQPKGHLRKGRKAFFPPTASARVGG